MQPANPNMFSAEFRLGIVLYGGVSLAIYENGVAQELFRAVKGEGAYTLIKQLLDADIVVDIMSGTSAGGINGVMLGYALANDLDFPSSADLWRKDGDILKLLRKKYDPPTYSLLDSACYYQSHLKQAFSRMQGYQKKSQSDVRSECSELDMFVTGTNVEGRLYTVVDDGGHSIDIKDHKDVFLLSYRQDRKNEFDRGNSNALATLSRLTSGFPVAFEPVCVTEKDTLLARWGRLHGCEPDSPDPGKSFSQGDGPNAFKYFYLDGAVLDNKPFSYTIDAIFRRTATRVVSRYLLYVEPDPEHFKPNLNPEKPDVARAAYDALIGIPDYQSISSDLNSINHHNDQVKRYWELFAAARASLAMTPCSVPPTTHDFQLLENCPAELASYVTARLGQLRDRVVDGILKKDGFFQYWGPKDRRAGNELVKGFRRYFDAQVMPKQRGVENSDLQKKGNEKFDIYNFDIYFRMRRLLFVNYRIKYVLEFGRENKGNKPVPLNSDERRVYSEFRRRLNHQIKLLEMFQFAMEKLVDYAPIPWDDFITYDDNGDEKGQDGIAEQKWGIVRNLLGALLDTKVAPYDKTEIIPRMDAGKEGLSEVTAKKQRKEVMAFLSNRVEVLVKGDISISPPADNLLEETDKLEWDVLNAWAASDKERRDSYITTEYCNFLRLDAQLFPMERLSGIGSLDQIKIVRLSPMDAQEGFSDRPLVKKICGRELAHFSAFLKGSWRANDVMWGRLDGACQLIQTLVTPESLERAGFAFRRVRLPELIARFPNSTANELDDLLSAITAATPRNRSIGAVNDLKGELILAAQREILAEEIPRVLKEAIRQQRAWNDYEISAPPTPMQTEHGAWTVGVQELDQAVTDYAADRLAKESAPPPGRWTRYMKHTYDVGSESWKTDVPKPVLLEICLRAAIGLREALVTSAGVHADKIRSNWLYKVALVWPLDIALGLTNFQRSTPEYAGRVLWGLAFGLAAVLGLDFYMRDRFLGSAHGAAFGIRGFLMLVVLPAVLLAFVATLIYFRGNED